MSNNQYSTLSRQQPIRQGARPNQPSDRPTYSVAFWITLIFLIIIVILLVILMVLYFRKSATQIDPSECPEQVTGLLATPDKKVTTPATNCPANVNCLYAVSSLSEAQGICQTLGTKCAAFSIDGSNMQVSSSTATTTEVGTDAYRIIQ